MKLKNSRPISLFWSLILSFTITLNQVRADYSIGTNQAATTPRTVDIGEFKDDTSDTINTAMDYILIIAVSLVGATYATSCLIDVRSMLSGGGTGGLTGVLGSVGGKVPGVGGLIGSVSKLGGGGTGTATSTSTTTTTATAPKSATSQASGALDKIKTKKVFSAWLYMITCLLYIGVEIYAFIKYKKTSTDDTKINVDGNYDQQISQLNNLKTTVDQYYKVVELKRKLMIAIFAAFTASTALSAIESALYVATLVQPSLKPTLEPFYLFNCSGNNTASSDEKSTNNILEILAKVMTYLPVDDAQALGLSTITDKLGGGSSSNSSTSALATPGATPTSTSRFGDMTQPVAFGKMIGMGGALILGLVAAVTIMRVKIISKFFSFPVTRLVFLAVVSSLAGVMAFKLLPHQAKRLQDRSTMLDNLIKSLINRSKDDLAAGTSLYGTPMAIVPGDPFNKEFDSLTASQQSVCLKRDQGVIYTDPTCACKKNNTCNQGLMDQNGNNLNFSGFPGSLSTSMNATAQTQNGLYSGNIQGASASAGQLGRMASQITKDRNSLIQALNNFRKENKLPPMDVDSLANTMKAKIIQATKSEMNKSGASDADISSFGGQLLGGTSSDKKLSDAQSTPKSSEAHESSDDKVAGGENGKAKKEDGMDFNFNNADNVPLPVAGGEIKNDSMANELDKYQDTKSDISNEAEKNIFKIISKRYITSAYPWFMEKK